MLRISFLCAALVCLFGVSIRAEDGFSAPVSDIVSVSDLPDLSYNTMGLQSATRADMWTPSRAQDLLDGLARLGRVTLTPELRKTADFLLQADVTQGGLTDPENVFGTDGFLAARARTALDLSLFETAIALVDLVPADTQSEKLRQIKINALLLSGDTQTACALVDKYDMGVYSDKIRISCFLAHEEKNKAVLSFAMYLENPDDDTLFQTLGNAVLNELPVDLPADFVMKPEHVYLMSLFKGAPLDVLQKQTAGIRFALADLPTTPVETRVALGERLGLTGEQMARLYKLPLFGLPHSVGSLYRADLFQKIKEQINPRTRATLTAQLFESLREDNIEPFANPLRLLMIADTQPEPDDWAIATDASLLLALDGREETAHAWRQILKDSPDDAHQFQRIRFAPVFAVAFDDDVSERDVGVFNDMCNRLKSEACTRFWAHMPADRQSEKPAFIGDIPASDTQHVQSLFDAGKIGEGMIELLVALAGSTHYDANLLRFLTDGAEQWNGRKVRLERMISY